MSNHDENQQLTGDELAEYILKSCSSLSEAVEGLNDTMLSLLKALEEASGEKIV